MEDLEGQAGEITHNNNCVWVFFVVKLKNFSSSTGNHLCESVWDDPQYKDLLFKIECVIQNTGSQREINAKQHRNAESSDYINIKKKYLKNVW